jgi:hypothetical protein
MIKQGDLLKKSVDGWKDALGINNNGILKQLKNS